MLLFVITIIIEINQKALLQFLKVARNFSANSTKCEINMQKNSRRSV